MGRLIFLDFDGVLRRTTSNPSRFDRDCLENFETVVRGSASARIVITSTWRLAMPMTELRGLFSSDIAARIVGTTPVLLERQPYERHAEVLAFLRKRQIQQTPWVAIDDDPAHFPAGSPVLLTDPKKGFDIDCAERLAALLAGEGGQP